jgi:uncharacterized membrane protein YgdD (TMEM256/DUF423 family)
MMRGFIAAGAILAALAVAAGAFGAHLLASRLPPDRLATWETAARYHMYHSLALIAAGLIADRWPSPVLTAAAWLFLAGILIFAGTVYALALGGPRWLGAITPLGGFAFIAGWVLVAIAVARAGDV